MDVAVLQTELRALREQVTSLQRENTLLRQKLDALARRFFGKASDFTCRLHGTFPRLTCQGDLVHRPAFLSARRGVLRRERGVFGFPVANGLSPG